MASFRDNWHKLLKRISGQLSLPRARVLQRRLTEIRDENQALRLDIEAVQDALEASTDRQAQAVVGLQEMVECLEAERNASAQRIETLQESLTQAVSRQERTEQQVMALEDSLQETRASHRAEMQDAHDRLRRQGRRSTGALLVAALAMIFVVVTSVIAIRDVRENTRVLDGMRRDLKDIKSVMEQQLADRLREPAAGNTVAGKDQQHAAATRSERKRQPD